MLLMHLRYCSLALNHRYMIEKKTLSKSTCPTSSFTCDGPGIWPTNFCALWHSISSRQNWSDEKEAVGPCSRHKPPSRDWWTDHKHFTTARHCSHDRLPEKAASGWSRRDNRPSSCAFIALDFLQLKNSSKCPDSAGFLWNRTPMWVLPGHGVWLITDRPALSTRLKSTTLCKIINSWWLLLCILSFTLFTCSLFFCLL